VQGNSRPVTSRQDAPHHDLPRLLARHIAHPFRKPAADYSRTAFATFLAAWDGRAPLVIDAACGTGESTLTLAGCHPEALVVGIDQSAQRLARGLAMVRTRPNALLLRANMVDFWRLMAVQELRATAQYLLYPNPWPRPDQVMRRWPAHPVFPTIIAVGGRIECRTNWRVYADEFAQAAATLTGNTAAAQSLETGESLTPFERKYRTSGHPLYQVVVDATATANLSPAAP
jgi:tRNA (guanine-N7-)-methyltransferase